MDGIEPWSLCTHKHADPKLAQAGPCPLHDAIGYCQICAVFIFDLQEEAKHKGPEHYVQKIARAFFSESS